MLLNLQELGVIKNKRGHGGTKNSTDIRVISRLAALTALWTSSYAFCSTHSMQ